MEWIKIGACIKPFGLKGEMKVFNMSDFVEKRFKRGNKVFLSYQNEMLPMTIATFRLHKDQPLISFEKHQNINLVEKYSKTEIFIKKSELHKLDKGEYYIFELKGLNVFDQDNKLIGKVLDIEPTGAHNVMRVKTEDKEILIPYIPTFIKDVNLSEEKIVVQVIEGLL